MVLKFIHKDIHRYIYFYSLLLMAASLPLSKFTLSVGEIALVANWILEGKFRQKAAIFKKHKSLWILVSFYAVLLIGMLYSKDWAFGIRYLRIELPILLIIPVIATSEKLSGNQLKIVLLTFCAAVFINTLISASILFGIIDYTYTDIRDISVFISHIRFSLMIVLTIFILSYFLFLKKSNLYEKILYPLVIAWLITSLFLFKTMTGIIIFLIIATTSIIYYSIRRRNLFIRISVIFIIISLFSYIVFYILQINKNLYPKNQNINNELRVKTENGNT